ncbi:hypothetical protein CQA53_06075 [Helicobacter didelphidarum]|uniref:DUF374 domain-containing protein n=1 Tax=Helicobacter didelphidarum TaxID=2040648 RepID=A0A3D8ILB1_9HELI|nr:lysophospholipid acyltransferase family protein [Helicobacter didelphidarum]RDU65725.1 hypothetical protein CQA53_06075 [Helicobacter didelphidarum]
MGSVFDKFLDRNKQKEIRIKYGDNVMHIIAALAYYTCCNKFHISEHAKQNPFIACLWHGNFLMMPYLYRKIRNIPNMSLVTSAHEDGIIVERYFAKFGLTSIRGSTGIHKGGAKALIQAIRELRMGKDIAVTPDGPKGPYKSIASGILSMAMKSGVAICGCRVKPKDFWELKTWDRFCIPKPFSRIDYYIAEPLILSQNMEIEEAREKLMRYMQEIDSL